MLLTIITKESNRNNRNSFNFYIYTHRKHTQYGQESIQGGDDEDSRHTLLRPNGPLVSPFFSHWVVTSQTLSQVRSGSILRSSYVS